MSRIAELLKKNPLDFETVLGRLPAPVAQPERLLLLGDIHANWHALAAVLEDAEGQYDAIWFVGDIVGYGPAPVECVRFLRHVGATQWCLGNHDLGVLGRLDRFLSRDAYMQPFKVQLSWRFHAAELRQVPELWEWFDSMVSEERVGPADRRYGNFKQVFVHAGLQDRVGHYLVPDDRLNIFKDLHTLELTLCDHTSAGWLVVGHTHMVCLSRLETGDDHGPRPLAIVYGKPVPIQNGCYLINPGSVGQPRDGDRRAAYAILDTLAGDVEFRRVEYDVLSVQREMRREWRRYALALPEWWSQCWSEWLSAWRRDNPDGPPPAAMSLQEVLDELLEQLDTARIRRTYDWENVYIRVEGGVVPHDHLNGEHVEHREADV